MDYRTLNALPPEAFLNPENFRTPYDAAGKARGYAEEQYQTGLKAATEYEEVGVSSNGTWYAYRRNGESMDWASSLTSYEGIGYHANTADLLRGLLAGTAGVAIHRQGGGKTMIKPHAEIPTARV